MIRTLAIVGLIATICGMGCKTQSCPPGFVDAYESATFPKAATTREPDYAAIPIKVGMTREMVESLMGEKAPIEIPPSGVWGYTHSTYKGFNGSVRYGPGDRVVSVFPYYGEQAGSRLEPR